MKTIIPCFVIAVMVINSLAITPFAFAMTADYQPKISFIDSQDNENHWSLPPPLPKLQDSKKIAAWFYGENNSVQIVIEGGDGVNKRYNKPFNSSLYPLSAIGRMGNGCTGFLIGPREVLTAAHCMFKDGKMRESFSISLNPFGHRRDGHKYPLSPVFGGIYNNFNDAAVDWYLLRSRENIGEKFGYLGIKNSNGETIPPSQKISAQAQEELKPYLRTSSDVLKNIREIGILYDLMENSEKTRVVALGFLSANYTLEYGGGGIREYPMSISNCHIRAYIDFIFSDCSVSKGGSGGPLLEITDGHAYAIGIFSIIGFSANPNWVKIVNIYKQLGKIYGDLKEHRQPTAQVLRNLTQHNIYLSIPTSEDEVILHLDETYNKLMIAESTPIYFQFPNRSSGYAPSDKFFERVRDYLNQTYNRYTAAAEECDWHEGFCFGTNWKTATPAEAQEINVRAKDQDGNTPLHWAAYNNENPNIILALEAGDIQAKNKDGNTPLHWAAYNNENPDFITVLIRQAGAHIFARDKDGNTPLHVAARFNENPNIIAALIQVGADIHAKDKDGDTPLHYAAQGNENPDIITALIQAGADIHAKDKDGNTPLHVAAQNNINPNIITAFIQTGAYLHAKDEDGRTPLHLAAAANESPDIITALKHAGADIHAKDEYGYTPLHWAAYFNENPDIITALIVLGADTQATNDGGETAEDIAKNKNKLDLYQEAVRKSR